MSAISYIELKERLVAWNSKATWTLPQDLRHGIASTNLAFERVKTEGISPVECAARLSDELNVYLQGAGLDDAYLAVPAGPYMNVALRDEAYAQIVPLLPLQPLTTTSDVNVMLEYIGANVAKRLHAGHMRNLNIGDALRRILLLKYGKHLTTDNHWGDWGVQFGVILWAYKRAVDHTAYASDPVAELQRLYVWGTARKDEVDGWEAQVRDEFIKLEQGDAENRRLWQEFVRISKAELARELPRLGVPPTDLELGESAYEGLMGELTSWLDEQDLWQRDGKARYFDLPELDPSFASFGRCYLVSSNGYTTYAYRDVAARIEWARTYQTELAITVTDKTQGHNFDQAFAIVTHLAKLPAFAKVFGHEVAGRLTREALVHVGYGFLSLTSGRMSTRHGNVLGLSELIDEVTEAAASELKRRDPEMIVSERERRARVLAVASLKWADLYRDPGSDVVLDPRRITTFEGNTGTYQLYTYARLLSVLRRGGAAVKEASSIDATHFEEAEKLILARFYTVPASVETAAAEYRPNLIANAVSQLTAQISRWYEMTPILKAPDDRRLALLGLAGVFAGELKRLLSLLGIEVLEEL